MSPALWDIVSSLQRSGTFINTLIAALKEGYATIGYERGRNTLVALNKWLMQRGMVVKWKSQARLTPAGKFV